MRKILLMFIMLTTFITLVACEETPEQEISWSISSNAGKTFIYEEIFVSSNLNKKPDWYLKVGDGDFELYSSEQNGIYFQTNETGIYQFKAVQQDIDSNIVTVEFVSPYGHTFGQSPLMERPTRGIDYKGDTAQSKILIHEAQNRTADQYTYFRNIYSTKYIISADIDILGINGQEPYPKAGLLAAQLNERKIMFAFDSRASMDYDDIIVVNHTASHGGTWSWPGTIYRLKNINFRTQNGSHVTYKLTVIREETQFYFFLDGELIMEMNFPDLTQATVAGTYTMGQSVKYTNYYAYQDDPTRSDDAYDLAIETMLNR